jgi:putative polyhydroxyalkanoate system protein
MPNVVVRQPHTLGAAVAKSKLDGFTAMLAKYNVKLDWSGNSAKIKGIGVGGKVDVSDSEVAVTVELGFAAKLAGIDPTKLQGSIGKRLQEALG